MNAGYEPDLRGEREREQEAAAGGIRVRAAVLDIDAADDALPAGEAVTADDGDDEAIEDLDGASLDASI